VCTSWRALLGVAGALYSRRQVALLVTESSPDVRRGANGLKLLREGFAAMLRIACLIWLAGLALIIYNAPDEYQVLQLAGGELIVGFLGKSHELVTVGGRPPKHGKPWNGAPKPLRSLPATLELGMGPPLRRGDSIYLWDLDHGSKRKLDYGEPAAIYGVTPSANGKRLCIESRSFWASDQDTLQSYEGDRVTVIDAKNGKVIGSVDWAFALASSISDDGKVLAYGGRGYGPTSKTHCLDVDTGKQIYTAALFDGFISPNGKYLAADPGCWQVIELNTPRLIKTSKSVTPISPAGFSPGSDKFIDRAGKVWDLMGGKVICSAGGPCTFADGGRKIAWIEYFGGGLRIKWQDLQTLRELDERDIRLPEEHGVIATADAEGNLVQVCGWHWRLPGIGNWLPRWLSWIFFRAGDTKLYHAWLLIDSRSGTIVQQGTGELQAVSSDGEYVISGEHLDSRVKVYKLPVHKSISNIVIAGAGWTMVIVVAAMLGWRWRRRRAKPVITAMSEPATGAP
jgi:WD40 repeat protein